LKIGGVAIGQGMETKIMGIINASPESFYKGSVRTDEREMAAAAVQMQECGAHIIDVGAMSTAPYLETVIPVDEEIRRIKKAIKAVKRACKLPVSADTPRAAAAQEAIEAGADAINDVTGLKYDSRMVDVVANAGLPVITGAYSSTKTNGGLSGTLAALKESLAIAKQAGLKDVIVDPSIGFFRKEGKNPFFTKMTDVQWYQRDIGVLSGLHKLRTLRKPVCISASRKSFIGHLLNLHGDDRLVPSIICEAVAVLEGASIIRTHNVRETAQALKMLQLLCS
jgi:dihydropteroate synthase